MHVDPYADSMCVAWFEPVPGHGVPDRGGDVDRAGAQHPADRPGRSTTSATPSKAHLTIVSAPDKVLDAGLRPRLFPDETASLLPGLLAATRTGLPPARDDELTNTKIYRGITPRCGFE
jgi:hypothetical protein